MENNPIYNQLMEQIVAESPGLANYIALFQQLMAEKTEETESERLHKLEKRLMKITSLAKRLEEDLNNALFYLENLVRALGACECMGDNSHCPACRGEGKAGFYHLDRELFESLILPAVRKASWIEIKEL